MLNLAGLACIKDPFGIFAELCAFLGSMKIAGMSPGLEKLNGDIVGVSCF